MKRTLAIALLTGGLLSATEPGVAPVARATEHDMLMIIHTQLLELQAKQPQHQLRHKLIKYGIEAAIAFAAYEVATRVAVPKIEHLVNTEERRLNQSVTRLKSQFESEISAQVLAGIPQPQPGQLGGQQ